MSSGAGWLLAIGMLAAWLYAGNLAFGINSEVRSRILKLETSEGRKAELLIAWRCLFMAVYMLIFLLVVIINK